ncbi:MAG: CPBP family intramembrane metalloprotease [Candidatus Zixiibacteriota bacterium]|nr:MAG: CPBP family intramembrane metalloprotease [candidate division Zixibacteria bacterium]
MKRLKSIFFNSNENRLRAGWRILIFIVFYILLSRILSKVTLGIFDYPDKTAWSWWVTRGFVVILASSMVVWVIRKYIDKKTFISLGLRLDSLAVKDFFMGLVISGLMIGTIFIIFLISGFLEIGEVSWNNSGIFAAFEILLWFFGIGLAVGWSEELAFRGYLLQNMKDGMGMFWAVLLSCLLYGLLHMSNPNSTLLSGVLIAVFGLLRIFGWLRTSQLWLSMGMHVGWDFFQGPILGFTVSGMNTESLIKHKMSGPNWITGGSFGPEAGIVVLPVIIFGLIFMYLWTVKRKNIPWAIKKREV